MKPMRDPVRLSAEPGLRAVLESAAMDDDADALARVATRLAAAGAITAVAAGALGSGAAVVPATTAAASTVGAGAALATKVTLVMLALVTVGAVATIVARRPDVREPDAHRPPASVSTERAIDPSPHAPAPEPAPPAPEPTAPSAAVQTTPHRAAPPVPTPAPTLGDEMALVARMRESVDTDPSETLRLAAEHRARFGESGRFTRDCERYETLARETLAADQRTP